MVFLSGGSNGWFDFSVCKNGSRQVFYSSGAMESFDDGNEDDMRDIVADVSCENNGVDNLGVRPLLQLPQDQFSCWQWRAEEGRGLAVLHGLPGLINLKRRLRITADGFCAFADDFPTDPCLVVSNGVQLVPAPESKVSVRDGAVSLF